MKLSTTIFNVKNIFTKEVCFAGGVSAPIGYILKLLYGAANLPWIGILFLVTVFDWVSGIFAAKKDGIYTSEYGREGVARTAVMLLFPVLGNLFDKVLGTPGLFFYFFTGGIIYHTWMSMTANFARAGWDKWIPNSVLEMVASEIQAKTQRAFERQQQLQTKENHNQKATE
jgi:toxin secretion/phage lysis holin